ncbi:MAG: hypothetical protein PUD50_04420, partial [Eubacteriales bacterium]|nr:hypothetical protein [Eubacteriales bacterium]
FFDKLADGEASAPATAPSPDFVEILRIPAAKSARQRFFQGEIRARGCRTAAGHDWNSSGPKASRALPACFDRL